METAYTEFLELADERNYYMMKTYELMNKKMVKNLLYLIRFGTPMLVKHIDGGPDVSIY